MHFVEEGAGDPVLLLHGEPTWAFLYRKMIPPLAARRTCGRARLLRLRPLGQADPDRGLLLRLPLHLDRAARGRARSSGRDGRRAGLGRPDRPAARRRAARTRRAARSPEHRHRRRPRAVARVASLPRVHPACRHGARAGPARPDLMRVGPRGRRRRGVQRALPDPRVEGGRARVPRAGSDRARPSERRKDARGARRARALGEAGARALLGLGPDLHADGRRTPGRPDPRRRARRDRLRRRPLPAGGEGRGDRRADRALPVRDRASRERPRCRRNAAAPRDRPRPTARAPARAARSSGRRRPAARRSERHRAEPHRRSRT